MTEERRTWPAGHVVHMTLHHEPVIGRRGILSTNSLSIAKCDCGWSNQVSWCLPALREQDDAIEQHWRQVDQAVPKAP